MTAEFWRGYFSDNERSELSNFPGNSTSEVGPIDQFGGSALLKVNFEWPSIPPLSLSGDQGFFSPIVTGLAASSLQPSTIGPLDSTDATPSFAAVPFAQEQPVPARLVAEPATEQSSTGPTIAVTSGGITFNLTFDAGAPSAFIAGIQQAASILSAAISDPITVNLTIHYSGTGGGAFAGPASGQFVSYSTVRSDLINDASPGDTIFSALPSGATIQGQSWVAVWNAELKLFGLVPANGTENDGSATFATDINPNLLGRCSPS